MKCIVKDDKKILLKRQITPEYHEIDDPCDISGGRYFKKRIQHRNPYKGGNKNKYNIFDELLDKLDVKQIETSSVNKISGEMNRLDIGNN